MKSSAMIEITNSQNRHCPVVNPGGYHGLANVAQIAVTEERSPRAPQNFSAPSGIRRTASNRSGNHRFTKQISANSTTIEMAQITFAEASMAKYGTFTSKPLPDPKMNQMKITGIEARLVWSRMALAGTWFLLTFTIASGSRFSRPDTNSSRANV